MAARLAATVWERHQLEWGAQTYVMGIINVTPDSFSGDGIVLEDIHANEMVQRAVEQAQSFVSEGAKLIDIGGESTRPNFESISIDQELQRVIPVVRALVETLPKEIIISVDTYKSEVARAALDAGASLINDIWGGQKDPAVLRLAAERSVPIVLMANMRGTQRREVLSDIVRFLARSIDMALEAGIAWEHLIIDPGMGFGLDTDENVEMLHRLGELRALGRPILLGSSRKSTIGQVLGGVPPGERIEGTAATVALGIQQGVDIVRVHDVREMVRVVRVSDAILR